MTARAMRRAAAHPPQRSAGGRLRDRRAAQASSRGRSPSSLAPAPDPQSKATLSNGDRWRISGQMEYDAIRRRKSGTRRAGIGQVLPERGIRPRSPGAR